MSDLSGYKWHNLCLSLKISINSGTALLLFLAAFFTLTLWAGMDDRNASLYPVAVGALTGAFGGFLMKRHTDKRDGFKAEVEKIKMADFRNRGINNENTQTPD